MLYREIIAVCSQIHTKPINTLWAEGTVQSVVKLAVRIVTTGCWRPAAAQCGGIPFMFTRRRNRSPLLSDPVSEATDGCASSHELPAGCGTRWKDCLSVCSSPLAMEQNAAEKIGAHWRQSVREVLCSRGVHYNRACPKKLRCLILQRRTAYKDVAQWAPFFGTVRPIYRTGTPLPSKLTFYVFFQPVSVLNFLNMLHTLSFFSLKSRLFHNATFFGSCIIRILHTGCDKI
jgi:hypothetical protein